MPAQPQKPYQILPLPTPAPNYTQRLQNQDSAVWQEGDVLHFLHRRKSGYVGVTGGVQESLKPLPEQDLWLLRVRMKGWDQAVIQYAFFTPERPAPPYDAYRVWRGPNAPKVDLAQPLKGKLEHITIDSKRLGEPRRLTVYLPPNAPPNLPAFYLADGEAAEGFAQALEPLILAGRMRPAAIVGIYSGDWEGHGLRSQEYGRRKNTPRYRKHRDFFAKEVPAWASAKYGVSRETKNLAAVGFSSGGSFVTTLASEAPGSFGTIIPLASGSAATPANPKPRYFFAVGTLDPSFRSTTQAAQKLKAPCKTYIGGHDFEIWRLAFSQIAPQVFRSPLLPNGEKGVGGRGGARG